MKPYLVRMIEDQKYLEMILHLEKNLLQSQI